MSNVQSYNALIDRFKAFASGHFILKRFSHGQIEVSDLEKFGEYPFMHVIPSNVTYSQGMKTFSFQIVLADLPRDKEDKSEYQREALSDLQRIAEDLIAEITNHRVLFGDLITVNNVSLEPFLEEFQHTLTGWTVSLDLLVPYYWDACSIPAEWNDFFESSTGGTGSILTFIDSITRDENGNVSLVNDETEPSPNYYYGTNDEGVRGWYLLTDEVGLTCETIGDCQTIIDIEAAIDDLQEEILLKANTADISAVGFSNDYDDLDNKPTIPDVSGFVPYTGATQDVDLGVNNIYTNKVYLLDEANDNHGSIHYSDGDFHIEDADGHKLLVIEDGFMQLHLTDTIQSNLFTSDLTATRDHYLPDQSGTIALTSDIPAAQVNSDWNATSGVAQILNKPTIPSIAGLVPETRTITINGTTQDLSANRTFTIASNPGTVTSVAALTLGTTGTDLSSTVANGTSTPVITLNVPTASATNRGALSSADWSTFNGKFTLPSLTSGSVLFSNGTTIAQDNANFFWDNTNKRLGIKRTPVVEIDVTGSIRASSTVFTDVCQFNFLQTSGSNLSIRGSGGTTYATMFQSTGNLLLQNGGTFTDAGYKLDVNGTARVSGTFISGGTLSFGGLFGTEIFRDGNSTLNFRNTFSNTTGFIFRTNSDLPNANTSGTNVFLSLPIGFAPTSGTGTWTQLSLSHTINQTGGANGITRGLYINPTLTASADYRAIETERGRVVFKNLPTSSAGLPTGALWNDAGTVKIV